MKMLVFNLLMIVTNGYFVWYRAERNETTWVLFSAIGMALSLLGFFSCLLLELARRRWI